MVNRVLKYAASKFNGKIPALNANEYTDLQHNLIKDIIVLVKEYCECMENVEIKNGAAKLLQISHNLNKYLQDS